MLFWAMLYLNLSISGPYIIEILSNSYNKLVLKGGAKEVSPVFIQSVRTCILYLEKVCRC
jgi:hypothetical protein